LQHENACWQRDGTTRNNLAVARLAGADKALHLSVGNRYSIISLILFVPYILLELPSNILLRRVGPKAWLTFISLAWGSVQIGMGFVKSWQALVVCRVLLGALEAGFFPALVLFLVYVVWLDDWRLSCF
jgi:MFS family permease